MKRKLFGGLACALLLNGGCSKKNKFQPPPPPGFAAGGTMPTPSTASKSCRIQTIRYISDLMGFEGWRALNRWMETVDVDAPKWDVGIRP